MDFGLELKIEVNCSLNPILYFYPFSFFNLCSFMFVDDRILWILMVEMLG